MNTQSTAFMPVAKSSIVVQLVECVLFSMIWHSPLASVAVFETLGSPQIQVEMLRPPRA